MRERLIVKNLEKAHDLTGQLVAALEPVLEAANEACEAVPSRDRKNFKAHQEASGEIETILAAAEVLELRIRELGGLTMHPAIRNLD